MLDLCSVSSQHMYVLRDPKRLAFAELFADLRLSLLPVDPSGIQVRPKLCTTILHKSRRECEQPAPLSAVVRAIAGILTAALARS